MISPVRDHEGSPE